MNIILNGQTRQLEDTKTIASLLNELKVKKEEVIVEVNLTVVPKKDYDVLRLHDNDQIEIVQFVGGG
jgi:sulfur carrier protein